MEQKKSLHGMINASLLFGKKVVCKNSGITVDEITRKAMCIEPNIIAPSRESFVIESQQCILFEFFM
jgi:hypothetical protein